MSTKLRLTQGQHEDLRRHLFPGDGKEAVAAALCGRSAALGTEVLLVHKLELVPHEACRRSRTRIDWHPTSLEPLLREASGKGLAVLKIHSHPTGLAAFSATDDTSDLRFFESVHGWLDGERPHASAIMLPDGRILARTVSAWGVFSPIDSVAVVGDDVRIDARCAGEAAMPAFVERHAQLFGNGTTMLLGRLRIAVVGCSGTGSPVVEQLVRLGVGELVLVDPDRVEERNLNRILGSVAEDARQGRLKVEVLADHVERISLGTRVHAFPTDLRQEAAVRAVAASDMVFGCVDSLAARNLLGRIARYYLLPYIDVGVKLEGLSDGTINQVAGAVHFVRPDGLDLLDRGVFSGEALEAEDLLRANPTEYRERLDRGYVRGVVVDRPAVISVNMLFASLAVNEALARLHPFRMDENACFATTRLSLSHSMLQVEADQTAPERLLKSLGRGDVEPLLGMPALSRENREAP